MYSEVVTEQIGQIHYLSDVLQIVWQNTFLF